MSKIWRKLWGRPATDVGNVYYVKLNTPQGIFYKLGYTSKNSVYERLSYAGYGDEKLIDKVILFSHRDDAYPVECKLHRHFKKRLAFGKYSKNPNQPLCNRGQGELYKYDVLGLDEDLYKIGEVIQRESVSDSFGGCLVIMFILVGLVGVPLGGWGIPVLIGVGCWYFLSLNKDMHGQLAKSGAAIRPRHIKSIQILIDELTSNEKHSK